MSKFVNEKMSEAEARKRWARAPQDRTSKQRDELEDLDAVYTEEELAAMFGFDYDRFMAGVAVRAGLDALCRHERDRSGPRDRRVDFQATVSGSWILPAPKPVNISDTEREDDL